MQGIDKQTKLFFINWLNTLISVIIYQVYSLGILIVYNISGKIYENNI
jgi:hypothetical protein